MESEIYKRNLIKIYTEYGFEFRSDFSSGDNLVFTISQGVFDNAVVISNDEEEKEKITSDLSDLGFHVVKQKTSSIDEVENKLFNGFFSVKKTKMKFESDYSTHARNIIKSFPGDDVMYNYIHSPFSKDVSLKADENDILSDILEEMDSKGPKLILIEAPAGFGKTCTAYEVGKKISDIDDQHIVLFAELSRDRHAKVFNHVLLKEVARSFPAVSNHLVDRQIEKGKIIVILDGFDELLNEREPESFQFEQSQAMLHTIGNILVGNAKVILTTRKTAILQGEDFDEWVNVNEDKFSFVRYSLREPSIKGWLGQAKFEKISNTDVNIKNLSNPVLLNFLRFITDSQFEEVISQPDNVVDMYFSLILIREMERQNLKLEPNEQSGILQRLAVHMMNKSLTKINKYEMTDYLSNTEMVLIEQSRTKYDAVSSPTFEAMIEKLSNHALLDRANSDEKIGFVNNFVLGHFLGVELTTGNNEWLGDSIFIDAVINAYSTKTLEARKKIWMRLEDSFQYVSAEEKLRFELTLLDRATGFFNEAKFTSMRFSTKDFFREGALTSCYFEDCTFVDCEFDFSKFTNNVFYSCDFYNCSSKNVNTSNQFLSSRMDDASKCLNEAKEIDVNNDEENQPNVDAFILEKFWPKGKETIAFAHRPMVIFYRGASFLPQEISDAINRFRKDGLIITAKRKNWVGLDLSGHNLNTIKEILGR